MTDEQHTHEETPKKASRLQQLEAQLNVHNWNRPDAAAAAAEFEVATGAVPDPGGMVLMGSGLLALAALRHRRR